MSSIQGKCPYCEDGIISYDFKQINGRKTKLYSCSNYKVTTEDGEVWEPARDSSCNWRVFGNSLSRFGKKFLGPREISKLLKGEEVIVRLYSHQKKTEYKKYAKIDETYGVSIIWELDVEENTETDE